MTRQYFCWKVCLTFRCGCVEYTPTAHRCGPEREGCNTWMTCKRTDKSCEEHRAGWWGLHSGPSLSPAEERYGDSSSSNDRGADAVSSSLGLENDHRHHRRCQKGEAKEEEQERAVTVAQRAEGDAQGRGMAESGGGEEERNWEGYYARRRV